MRRSIQLEGTMRNLPSSLRNKLHPKLYLMINVYLSLDSNFDVDFINERFVIFHINSRLSTYTAIYIHLATLSNPNAWFSFSCGKTCEYVPVVLGMKCVGDTVLCLLLE